MQTLALFFTVIIILLDSKTCPVVQNSQIGGEKFLFAQLQLVLSTLVSQSNISFSSSSGLSWKVSVSLQLKC